MTDPVRTCSGAQGACPHKVYSRGLCLSHYRKFLRKEDIDKPIRGYRGVDEQLVPPRVERKIRTAIKAVCELQGISEYEFMRRLVEDWYASYERTIPGQRKGGATGLTTR